MNDLTLTWEVHDAALSDSTVDVEADAPPYVTANGSATASPILGDVGKAIAVHDVYSGSTCVACYAPHTACTLCTSCWQCEKECLCVSCPICETRQVACECAKCARCHAHRRYCVCADNERIAAAQWGLPYWIDLHPIAADFYTLYERSIRNADNGELASWLTRTLPRFLAYTDMVIGGEIRHASDTILCPDHDPLNPLAARLLVKDKQRYAHSRGGSWVHWKAFRHEHGSVALQWAADIYNKFSGGSYGGPMWANIADTLRLYETGMLSDTLMMDLIWGLQHNSGRYFNKLGWDHHRLERILDENQAGRMENIRQFISKDVLALCATRTV